MVVGCILDQSRPYLIKVLLSYALLQKVYATLDQNRHVFCHYATIVKISDSRFLMEALWRPLMEPDPF